MSLVERDRGWAQLVRAAGQRGELTVGIQGTEAGAQHRGSTLTNAEIGAVHEYGATVGSTVIPQRSFLRSTVDRHQTRYLGILRAVGAAALSGNGTLRDGLELLGEVVVGDVKQAIADGIAPPNAPATVARKGSSTPLIHHGQLRNSISSEVK